MCSLSLSLLTMEDSSQEKQSAGAPSEPFLAAPISLDGDSHGHYKAPGMLAKALSLLSSIRTESDFAKIQVPPTFNMPKSQLQWYGECVYCVREDLLGKCVEAKSSLDRFMAVVAWCISTTRPTVFGMAPFNSILGETHHVSSGTLNVILEQVSHHPPVSALHATDENRGIELTWHQAPSPRFMGTGVEAVINGKRQLKLSNFNENYVMNIPKFVTRFFPSLVAEWVGNVGICCPESCLEATLTFKGPSLLGFGRNRGIKGKVVHSLTKKLIYELDGHWDKVVTKKEKESGTVSTLYNASEALTGLRTPSVKDANGLLPNESSLVWAEVSKAIVSRDWDRALDVKTMIEERQRRLQRERASKGIVWQPKFFNMVKTEENGWECSPKQISVPPAPIVI